MPSPRPPTDAILRTAADLRATGTPWDAVGAAVGFAADTVRKWPLRYPARWRKATHAAERRTLLDATAEAIMMLRKQLRADDDKTVREAAARLVQIRVALDRARKPSKKQASTSADPPGYADRLVRHARSLTDEQIRELQNLVDGESGGAGAV